MSQLAVAVLAEVAERIKSSGNQVRGRVVDALVEKEVAKRADTLDKALAKFNEFSSGLKKLGPDQIAINAEGVKSETYSKARWEERKKTQEKADKLSKALEAALTDGTFNDLAQVLTKLGQNKPEPAAEESGE